MDLLSPRQSALLHSLEKQIRDDYLRLTPEDEEAVLFLIKLKYISVFELTWIMMPTQMTFGRSLQHGALVN